MYVSNVDILILILFLNIKEVLMTLLKRQVLPTFITWNSANPTAVNREMCSGRFFHVLKLQCKKNSSSLQSDLFTWHQSNLSKVVQLLQEQKTSHQSREEKPETTWFELLRSLGKCIDLGSAWVVKGEGWMRASKPQGSEMWMTGLNLTWCEKIAQHCFQMNLIKSSFLLHSYQHLPAIKCPQLCCFKREVFLEHAWENNGNNGKKKR